jgi:general secretion pathway protein G
MIPPYTLHSFLLAYSDYEKFSSAPCARFTLIEIMVVVVIMGVLAALVVPKLNRTGESKVAAAKVDIATIMQALKLYKLDNQRYPTTEQGLQALLEKPTGGPAANGWKAGGYLEKCRKTRGAIPTSSCRPASRARSTCSPTAPTASPAAPATTPTSVRGITEPVWKPDHADRPAAWLHAD